jgi:hypothetical protein
MSYFLSELKKVMAEQNLTQTDIQRMTAGKVKQPWLAAVLSGFSVARERDIIDALSGALNMDVKRFRKLSFLDRLSEFGLELEDICNEAGKYKLYDIPIFNWRDLRICLTEAGYPILEKAIGQLRVPGEVGGYAYACRVDGQELSWRVLPSEVMVLSQDYERAKVDFGIVAFRDKAEILIGRITDEGRKHVQIETFFPFGTTYPKKKDILFIHRVAGTIPIPNYGQRKAKKSGG